MAGVWIFKDGVIRQADQGAQRKALVHLPSGEVVSSYSSLERILRGLGWERYPGTAPDLLQFHKHSSIDLISLPRDFSKFNSVHMFDMVVKHPDIFRKFILSLMNEFFCTSIGSIPGSVHKYDIIVRNPNRCRKSILSLMNEFFYTSIRLIPGPTGIAVS